MRSAVCPRSHYEILSTLSRRISAIRFAIAGESLIVQLGDGVNPVYDHLMYSPDGLAGSILPDTEFNLTDYQWDQTNSRLYGFKQESGEKTDLGYLVIKTGTNEIDGGPIYSGSVDAGETLAGPIEFSLSRDFIILGSGQKFLPALVGSAGLDLPPLVKTYKGQNFSEHLLEHIEPSTRTNIY